MNLHYIASLIIQEIRLRSRQQFCKVGKVVLCWLNANRRQTEQNRVVMKQCYDATIRQF